LDEEKEERDAKFDDLKQLLDEQRDQVKGLEDIAKEWKKKSYAALGDDNLDESEKLKLYRDYKAFGDKA